MEELGTMGRIFGALISKAGIPIPTEITPKVLSAAQHISKGGIISEGIFYLVPSYKRKRTKSLSLNFSTKGIVV